jgi:hypothetical protein
MKTRRRFWSWAVAIVALALMLQGPLTVGAQDAQLSAVAPAAQSPQDAQGTQNPQAPQDTQPPQSAQAPQDAQPPSDDAQNANAPDPPSRVARLNFMEGSVSFQPGGENDWVTAVLNRPLVTGDNLWADEDSRAEVHIGSTALRLAPKTGITLLEVSDRATQIRLAQGSLIVKVRHVDDEDSYEIDTPNVAFSVMQPGDYRIDVDPNGSRTDVTVWHGRGTVTGGGSSYTVVADQHASFTGTDQLNYDLGQIPQGDGFDNWAFERDRNEDSSDSANYVSREMTGYEDLDEYGDWSYVAGYGTCWHPRAIVAGWAPYRYGHWVWVGPWGWTWVEDEPWGFAPFHYGRWAFAGAGWFWVPGPVVVRPIYAPALVAWVGGGPGFGFSFSFGAGVGWFPLAPGEVFIPGYRVSRTYVNRVNITNTTVNVTRINNVYNTVVVNRTTVNNITYANRGVNGGVTVVSRDTFVNARPVARNVVSVPARELATAPVSHTVAAEPARASVLGTGRPVANRPPATVTNRQVVALRTPAPMPRSLDQRQAQAGGRLSELGANQQNLVRQEAPGRPVPQPNQGQSNQPQANSGTRQPQTQQRAQTESGGFRTFTPPNGRNNQANPQSRVWEAQGTPEPQRNAEPQSEGRSTQPEQNWSHPLARPAPPVEKSEQQQREQEQKFNSWQQQRPAPQPRQQSHPPAQHQQSSPKKGR